jgi:uncharacterized protein
MPRKFGEIAFTPEVQAAQSDRGSRQTYERYIANGDSNDTITPKIADFIAQLDGFYLGTVGSNGRVSARKKGIKNAKKRKLE